MEQSSTTTVFLTPIDAALFMQFQKHYELFKTLEAIDAFSIKGGFFTVHMTPEGMAGSIDIQRRYKVS